MSAMTAMAAIPLIPSRYQQQLTRCLSGFEIAVGLCRIFQLVSMSDVQLQLAGCDPAQHVAGALLKLFSGCNVMPKTWPCQEQGPFLGELHRIERRHRAAGATEQNQMSARAQDLEIFVEGGFAHTVVHHVHAFPACEALGFYIEILPSVDDHLVGAGLA